MFTEEERAKFKQRFAKWKETGEYELPRFEMGTEGDKRKSTKGNRFVDMSVEELEALSKAVDLYWENKLRELSNRSPETIRQMGIDADKEYRKRNPDGGLSDPKLQRANDLVVSSMKSLIPFTGEDYKNAANEQRLHSLDKWHDYKKGIEATAKAAELTLSTGTLVGAYANWKKWKDLANVARPTFSQLTKSKIANLLLKALLPMLVSGTVIDGVLTYDALLNNDSFNAWWNGLSTIAGVGGSIGAADLFNNARLSYPVIDRIFDTSGIIQSAADVLRYGTDYITNTQNNKENEQKTGELVYEAGLPAYKGGKPGSKRRYDYKYVQAGKDNEWERITDDEMSDVFLDFVARPKSRGGNTDTYNWNKQWALKGEPGLEIVSPEFELLSGIRALMPTISGADRKAYHVMREMNKGLKLNPALKTYNGNARYLDTGGNVLLYLDYLRQLFPDSKIGDIVYHSTWAKPFEQFDPSKVKRGYGFYFSPSEHYLPFSRTVYAKVNLKKPLRIFPNENRELDVSGLWGKLATEQAIKKGNHDGIVGVSNMRNPGEPEIVALNPNQIHILGSNGDVKLFSGFMDKINRKTRHKDGYIYKDNAVTPDRYKYYGQKVNYSDPSVNELSDYLLDDMIGDYMGRGAERTVYQDLRNSNRVLKITDGGSPDVQITNPEDLLDYIDESLKINDLPEVPKLSYEGFIKDADRYLPVFSLQKVIPLKKVADPFLIFTRQYVLPNGKTPSGKLSAIRRMNPDALSRIGYKPIPTKSGVYSVNGVGGPYNVTDLGLKNVGIDALGNLKIFDPMFE